MITNLAYYDGKPVYSETIKRYLGEEMPPCWRCNFREDYRGQGEELEAWLGDNMTGTYECTFRFNSGDPCYFITIHSEDDLTAFRLRWA